MFWRLTGKMDKDVELEFEGCGSDSAAASESEFGATCSLDNGGTSMSRCSSFDREVTKAPLEWLAPRCHHYNAESMVLWYCGSHSGCAQFTSYPVSTPSDALIFVFCVRPMGPYSCIPRLRSKAAVGETCFSSSLDWWKFRLMKVLMNVYAHCPLPSNESRCSTGWWLRLHVQGKAASENIPRARCSLPTKKSLCWSYCLVYSTEKARCNILYKTHIENVRIVVFGRASWKLISDINNLIWPVHGLTSFPLMTQLMLLNSFAFLRRMAEFHYTRWYHSLCWRGWRLCPTKGSRCLHGSERLKEM